ncbi:MAG: hypothetical protein OEM67_10515 [Thermoleophilia bacterium]|nr:hypothetical protein [Thermoleophilia bacterium]
MPKYLFAYHGGWGMPESEEEQAKVMAAWGKWFEDNGAAIADPGNPLGRSATLAADRSVTDGGGANPLTGYTTFNADTFEDALDIAKTCPMLDGEGSVVVYETIDM